MADRRLPEAFCWTRMGAESGEALDAIIRRKEMERQAGNGSFFWGIGGSPGAAVAELAGAGAPQVLFSRMRSDAAAHDSDPAGVIVWNAYRDRRGAVQPLPPHALVTSRSTTIAAAAKRHHYVLLCSSSVSLPGPAQGELRFNDLVNYTTNRPLGFSQVTALVKHRPAGATPGGPVYEISFRADLVWPYSAQLVAPVLFGPEVAIQIEAASAEADPRAWHDLVAKLRRHAPPDLFNSTGAGHG